MGRATADSSNLSRGWRDKRRGANPSAGGQQIGNPKMKKRAGRKTPGFPTGNSHRGKGNSNKRRRAGGMAMKHHSIHTHRNM